MSDRQRTKGEVRTLPDRLPLRRAAWSVIEPLEVRLHLSSSPAQWIPTIQELLRMGPQTLASESATPQAIGGFDPAEWEFPPKPKWMRWSTYERAKKQFDRYQAILDQGPGWV